MADNLPGIFLNTMPKSGSLYLWQVLEYGLCVPACRVSHSTFPGDIIVPEWLDRLRCGNVVTQEHIPASLENLAAMSRAGVKKIIVHVRDPRQATVSWMHHIIKRWEDNPDEELEDDTRISKVIPRINGSNGFEQPFIIEDIPEAVIFPLGNNSGSGYGNVFATFGGLRPGQFFLAPYGRELRPVSPLTLRVKYLIERGLQKALAPLGILTARRLTSRIGLS